MAIRRLFRPTIKRRKESKRYIHAITHWSAKDLLKETIDSIGEKEEYFVVRVKEYDSLAQAWNEAIKSTIVNGDYDGVVIMADDVKLIGNTGGALFRALEEYGPSFKAVMTTAYDVNLHGPRGIVWISALRELICSACFCVKREFVDQIGLFDERFKRIYFEDSDILCRAYKAGREVVIVAPIYHEQAGTSKADPEFAKERLDIYNTNYDRYVHKWGGPPGREIFDDPR